MLFCCFLVIFFFLFSCDNNLHNLKLSHILLTVKSPYLCIRLKVAFLLCTNLVWFS